MNLFPKTSRILLAAALVSFAFSPAGHAQTAGSGAISGTVTDSSGAVLPNVSIRIINTETGIERTITSTNAGAFQAQFLQPGAYEVIATSDGFATVDQKHVVVLVGQTVGLDVKMPLQSQQANVEVTDATPVIDTEKIGAAQQFDSTLLSNLPVNGRRFDNFVLSTPNVAPDGTSGLISYRGVSGLYNSNLVDGLNNNQAFFSEARGRSIGAPYVYSLDSIREFQSAISGYSAEFGQAAGGQINAITKSGTNKIHGDLFYYLRYPSLNALDPYNKRQGLLTNNALLLQQPVKQQHQFGGSVGGPILHDKLFYFFTYDGFRKVTPIFYTTTSSIPLASICSSMYSASANATGPAKASNFITTTQCNTAVNFLQSIQGGFARNIKQDIFFPKIDYAFNDKNKVTASFNWENFNEPNGYNTSTTVTNGGVTQNGAANFHERFLNVVWNSQLTDHSINEVRFQWARDLESSGVNSSGPSNSISGLAAYGAPNALPRPAFPDEHRWQIADIYSITKGKHSIKAGVDLNFINEKLINLFQGDGVYTYANSVFSSNQTLSSFQSWLYDTFQVNDGVNAIGQHWSSFTQVHDPITGVGADEFWAKQLAGFVEDDYRITSNFLVRVGVRYDVQLTPQPPRPNTTGGSIGEYYTNKINISYHQIQPRVGFSWQPTPNTVVRAGYGIFYGLTSNSTFYTMRVENGVFQQQYSFNSRAPRTLASVTNTYGTYDPQAPNVFFTPPGPALAAAFDGAPTPVATGTSAPLSTQSYRGLDPNFLNPYTHSMDLAVEQKLPGRMSLSIGYVGTRAMRLPIFTDGNIAPTSLTRTYGIQTVSGGAVTKTVTVPFYTSANRITTQSASILAGYSTVNTWYHSMATTIRRPFNNGLEILVNYTWAKTMDNGQVSGTNGTFNGTDTPFDQYNIKGEHARSDLDMRNRFVGSIVYSPTFNLASKWAKVTANGWTFAGSTTQQTGFPVTGFMSNSPTGAYAGPNGGLTGSELSLYNSGTSGRVPTSIASRNSFPGPGLRNVDARLGRAINIHQGIKLDLTFEAFNVLNQTNRTSVSTNYYTWVAPSSAAGAACPASQYNGCLYPYTSTPFGSTTSTSGVIVGARQLQLIGRITF